MSDSMRILIVDDQARARQSLMALIATWPQLSVVGEAASGEQAIRFVAESRPDAVLIDARMPGMDGVEATRAIKTAWPEVKVIVLSMYVEYLDSALAAGADAFVSKGARPENLLVTLTDMARSPGDDT